MSSPCVASIPATTATLLVSHLCKPQGARRPRPNPRGAAFTMPEIALVCVSPCNLVHLTEPTLQWEVLIPDSLRALSSCYWGRGVPRAIFRMVCNSPVQMVHLCSRNIWIHTVVLLLQLAINFIKHLFHHHISLIIPYNLYSTTASASSYGSSQKVICIATWTCYRPFLLRPTQSWQPSM